MNNKTAVWSAWAVSVVVVASSVFAFVLALDQPNTRSNPFGVANAFLNALYYSFYGLIGALILARQTRNTVGWLLMAIGVSLTVVFGFQTWLGQFMRPVETPDWTTYLFIWMSGWTWWLLMGPLLLILLVFPTGRLFSPRWRWVVALIGILFVIFLVLATIGPTWQDPNSGKILPNPFGVLPISISFDMVVIPWAMSLFTTVALCVASVFVRYRRSSAVEREQLKWFLYACAVFLCIFAIGAINLGKGSGSQGIFTLLFDSALAFIPVSIGIAILRYRLFDIDIIIRRTLVYALLTAMLALFYFGYVTLLQRLLSIVLGPQPDLAIIVSTLAIAALFVPVRNRVQRVIDHRFYRRKYNAAHVLATFAATARDEVDLARLTDELQTVVEETMQPQQASFWLKPAPAEKRKPQ